jgi:hypothetical protein
MCPHAASPATSVETTASVDIEPNETSNECTFVIEAFDALLESIKLSDKRAEEREILAKAQRLNLPPADVIERVIRCETHLDRRLYRAMDQLERLQRQRRGEARTCPRFSTLT